MLISLKGVVQLANVAIVETNNTGLEINILKPSAVSQCSFQFNPEHFLQCLAALFWRLLNNRNPFMSINQV